jgi:RNA polymerase sigma factor (sigma-70 family)
MEDQKIIELIRSQRQDTVFTTLYKYFPVVKKLILANGGRSEDAEDIYQDALIIFYKKAGNPEFKLTSTINTYLYSIARFMWKDQLRKKTQHSFTDIQQIQVPEQEFVSEVETENKYKPAEKVIAELGDRCKELLLLFYFESLKLKEIAKKMGYNSENTAKNQKYKCLETAKNRLKVLQTEN